MLLQFPDHTLHQRISNHNYDREFYLWVLHPVAHLSNLVSYDAVNRNKQRIDVHKDHSYYISPEDGL
jgi:hypothetical protein